MKIIHYIPSIDRTAGGTSTYMQVLAKGLGELAEVHIITHASENPLVMENCMVHYVPEYNPFQTSDFFVLPTHSENFGLAIAESLASGTPVITTVGTPWNDLNDTNSGAWIEIGTQPLTETLRKFLALSDGELEAMGRNGRKLIEEKYSAHVMAKEMMEVYETLIPNLTNGY